MLYIFYYTTFTVWAISYADSVLVLFQLTVTTLKLKQCSLILEAAKLYFNQIHYWSVHEQISSFLRQFPSSLPFDFKVQMTKIYIPVSSLQI